MKLNEAVAVRIREILKERKMTQYRLEQNSGVSHNTMICLMNGRYKSCNLSTVFLIAQALGMTISEFFSHPVFESEDLMVE